MRGDLGWLKRIMFLLPVVLGIAIANIAVVKLTRTRYNVPSIQNFGTSRSVPSESVSAHNEKEQIEKELQKGWELLEKFWGDK